MANAGEIHTSLISGAAELTKEVERLTKQAVGATDKVRILPIDGDPHERYLIVKADGSHEIKDQPMPSRADKLLSIDQIGTYIDELAIGVCGFETDRISIWLSRHGIVIEIDSRAELVSDNHRCHVGLEMTEELKSLQQMTVGESKKRNQKEFIRLLRVNLRECWGDGMEALIKQLRTINFDNGAQGRAEVHRGRESVDAQVRNEVTTDAGDVPDEIVLQVRLYNDRSLLERFPIRCAIEIDPETRTFELIPVAGQIERAIDEQMERIEHTLESTLKNIPVLYGV